MNAPIAPIRLPKGQKANEADTIRVMIVDDSLTVRTIFKRMIEAAPGLQVAATASNAENAIDQLNKLDTTGRIDVVLLDLAMPGMGGLEALPLFLGRTQSPEILVVSSLTEDGAEETLKALSMGAADTMLKPRPGGFNEEYRHQLLAKIHALGSDEPFAAPSASVDSANAPPVAATFARPSFRPEVIAVGASTGGIHALNIMLQALPVDFNLPILITQHLPASFMPIFARQVEVACNRRTVIAEDGTQIRKNEVAVATGHGHMVVRREHGSLICRLSTDPVRSGCLPSVDPMLSSLAQACDGKVLAVILSGMGRDGSDGASQLVNSGGVVFAQDAETSAVWGMPGAVAKAGIASLIAPPEQLAQAIATQATGACHQK